MIYELLAEGRDNARTGRYLADICECDIRAITAQIEKERRAGFPICATTGDRPGYYKPADDAELVAYCDRLKGRAIELFKTRQALMDILKRRGEALAHEQGNGD